MEQTRLDVRTRNLSKGLPRHKVLFNSKGYFCKSVQNAGQGKSGLKILPILLNQLFGNYHAPANGS